MRACFPCIFMRNGELDCSLARSLTAYSHVLDADVLPLRAPRRPHLALVVVGPAVGGADRPDDRLAGGRRGTRAACDALLRDRAVLAERAAQ